MRVPASWGVAVVPNIPVPAGGRHREWCSEQTVAGEGREGEVVKEQRAGGRDASSMQLASSGRQC